MVKIDLGDKKIGEDEPCYIIAEAGRNHNGDIYLAEKLIKAAAKAGADAIKFQSFRADTLITKETQKLSHVESNTKEDTAYEATKKVELTKDMHLKLKEIAKREGIEFFSTPEDHEMADLLDEIGVKIFKVASIDLLYHEFLQHIARKKKPMIISTGMSNIEEIKKALEKIKEEGNEQIAILHCVSAYPPLVEDVNLNALLFLKENFDNIIGYSDHTLGTSVPIASIILGAKIVEKHFTLDKNLPGPDHKVSANPEELKEMIDRIREVEKKKIMSIDNLKEIIGFEKMLEVKRALGKKEKFASKSELEMKENARRKIVANEFISKGSTITRKMLGIKIAGGGGLNADYLSKIIGKKAEQDIERDTKINLQMLSRKEKPEKNILAIGAHFDDIELGCGGTIAKHLEEGDNVTILYITNSEYNSYNGNPIRPKAEALEEVKKAMEVLGIKEENFVCLDYPTKKVPYDVTLIETINQLIDERKIDTIYTHWIGDVHQDHSATSRATINAARHVPRILMYRSNWYHTREIFNGKYFVDISSFIDKKIGAIRAHKGELGRRGEKWVEFVKHQNKNSGIEMGVDYAEVFEVIKFLEG